MTPDKCTHENVYIAGNRATCDKKRGGCGELLQKFRHPFGWDHPMMKER